MEQNAVLGKRKSLETLVASRLFFGASGDTAFFKKHSNTEKRRSVLRTLWPSAAQVPQGTSEGLIHQSIDLRRADTAPKRDRSAGTRDAGAAGEADGTGAGDHRADES